MSAKYQTVKRGGRNTARCESCRVTVNRLQAYRTPLYRKACKPCATAGAGRRGLRGVGHHPGP